MPEIVTSPFVPWENFMVIVGSSAAALTGLMFVVIALVTENRKGQAAPGDISAFGTPNVVHFSIVLVISAILSAPWRTLVSPAAAIGAVGLFGVGYAILTTIRAMRSANYKPVMEDWIWHTMLPFVAYATITISATLFTHFVANMLFAIAGAMLLLVLIGIHNAWDTVTYFAVTPASS